MEIKYEEIMKKGISDHLLKFKNINIFLKEAEKEVLYYFNLQEEYKNIDDFKKYLIFKIKYYVDSFGMSRKNKNMDELDFINETYDKIIYYGEFNPVEARRQRLKEKGELHIDTKKEKGYFINILNKILEDIKKES